MKIASEQSRSAASPSVTVTSVTADAQAVPTRTTTPQLKHMRPNYFISLPIKNENIKGAIQIFEEFYKKNDPKNASGLTGYQKVNTLKPGPSIEFLVRQTNFQAHVTVAVFHLEESEICLVQEMMDEIKTEVENILSQPVSFKGLGNFNKKVIFVQENFSNPKTRNNIML